MRSEPLRASLAGATHYGRPALCFRVRAIRRQALRVSAPYYTLRQPASDIAQPAWTHHCANPWTPDKRFFRLSASSARGHIGFRSEEHTSELQSLMRISYAVFCLKKKKYTKNHTRELHIQ